MAPEGIKDHLFAITGAASGIGRATALLLAENGALLSLADKDEDAVLQLTKQLTDNGVSAHGVRVDVRDRDEVEAWILGTVEKFGGKLDGKCASTSLCAIIYFSSVRIRACDATEAWLIP